MRISRSLAGMIAVVGILGSIAAGGSAFAAASATPSADGTLQLVTANPAPGDDLTFSYTTSTPNTKNWIAVYDSAASGPTDQTSHGASTDWAYVDATTASGSGTVTVKGAKLTPGHDITAYLLYSDGYEWLAKPITFTVGYATTGTLALTTATPTVGSPLTFSYATDQPTAKNWVAIYNDPAAAPVNQKLVSSSSEYSYASASNGTVTIPSTALTAGHDVVAYFLHDDGYTWLATPITFQLQAAASTPAGPTANGTLTLETAGARVGDDIQFSFTTDTPNELNWIGIYADPSKAPTNGQSNGGSTIWTYVGASTSGTATLNTASLPAGKKVQAMLLYNDGYVALAPPVQFTLAPKPATVGPTGPTTAHFVTDDLIEPAVGAAGSVSRSIAGMWRAANGGASASPVTFSTTDGPGWLSVSADGLITGTAPASTPSHPALLTITAKDTAGVTGTMIVEFPVVEPGATPTLKVETLEAWDGGSHVDNPVEKLARSVLADHIDLLGLQGTGGTEGAALASVLGWNVAETPAGLAVLTPYAIAPKANVPADVPAISADVDVRGSTVQVWNVELAANTVDPASVCSAGAAATVAAERDTTTFAQATALAKSLGAITASRQTRVVLLGALQSPSNLDWTASAPSTCGVGSVEWPVTAAIGAAGFSDAFRSANPSEADVPGDTSTVFTGTANAAAATSALAAASTPATLGRVDYVDTAGPIAVSESHTAVDGFPAQGSAANRWTSNHAAVGATLVLAAAPGGGTDGAGNSGPARGGTDPGTRPAGALAFTGPAAVLIPIAVALALLGLGALLVYRRRVTEAGVPSEFSSTDLSSTDLSSTDLSDTDLSDTDQEGLQ